MKLTLTSIAALLALTASANAADLAPLNINPVAPAATIPATNWTGFYLGAHVGYAEADYNFDTKKTTTPDEKNFGAFGGGQMGYNYQLGRIVLGAEADISAGDFTDKVKDGNSIIQTTSLDAFGTVRGRVGYAVGNLLPYVTGGLAWGSVTSGENCAAGNQFGHCRPIAKGGAGAYNVSNSETMVGWTIGAGLEYAVAQNISLRVEYLHDDFGTEKFTFPAGTASSRSPSLTADMVRLGVNYRVGSNVIPLK